jgi:hypothetical protein
MKIQLLKMKAELKALAKEIRQLKSTRKQCQNGCVTGLQYIQHEFRYKHIAYCMLRGRTIEQIEPKVWDMHSWGYHNSRKEATRIVKSILESINAQS